MPSVPQRNAIQSLVFGHDGVGVPKESTLQRLLLAHVNHIDELFDMNTLADPNVEGFLVRLGNKRNEPQKKPFELLWIPA